MRKGLGSDQAAFSLFAVCLLPHPDQARPRAHQTLSRLQHFDLVEEKGKCPGQAGLIGHVFRSPKKQQQQQQVTQEAVTCCCCVVASKTHKSE
jgi:hypothetical protein